MQFIKYLVFIVFMFSFIVGNAQETQKSDTSTYRVTTKDGNEFIGNIIFEDDRQITLRTYSLGQITIQKTDIKSLIKVEKSRLVDGVYWFDNPQATRYFWAPNGYGLHTGEGYYQNVWIFFNQVSIGLNENFSIGFGMMPLFLIAGSPTPVWITPKFSIPISNDNWALGGGVLAGTVIGASGTGFGIVYGTTTFGSKDSNVSFGLGYGYAGGDFASSPTINVSAMIRTGARGYIITENYYIGSAGENVLILSVGGRRIINRAGLDFGLFTPLVSGEEFIAIPWLGLTVPIGRIPGEYGVFNK